MFRVWRLTHANVSRLALIRRGVWSNLVAPVWCSTRQPTRRLALSRDCRGPRARRLWTEDDTSCQRTLDCRPPCRTATHRHQPSLWHRQCSI